jgi:hypothetical protein
MKENKRAYRRAQRERLKVKRVRGNYHGLGENRTVVQLSSSIDTPNDCSCLMCCNRRKVDGLTKSEKVAVEAMKYDLKHVS